METVEPVGDRVLICKDQDKKTTKGGIQLPDRMEIPTITGVVVAISANIEANPDYRIKQYDKVLFNPARAIPVELEIGNPLFVVPIDDIVAILVKTKPDKR